MGHITHLTLSSSAPNAHCFPPQYSCGIVWLVSGSLKIVTPAQDIVIGESQYCFFRTTDKLEALSIDRNSPSVEARIILFDPNFLEHQLPNTQGATTSAYPIFAASDLDTLLLRTLYSSLELSQDQHTHTHITQALLAHMNYCDPTFFNFVYQSLSLSLVERIIWFIDTRLDQDLSLGNLAQYLGCSESTIKRRLFDESLSFSELLRTKRLHKAATLLRSGRQTITTIATQSGFNSAAHFASSFKGYYGCTPKTFRRERRKP